jgi:hypothetical protein
MLATFQTETETYFCQVYVIVIRRYDIPGVIAVFELL